LTQSLAHHRCTPNKPLPQESPMRKLLSLPLLIVAACSDPVTGSEEALRPQHVQNGVDTVGLPDLIVDTKATQQNWLVRVEDLPANFCSVEEGNITPGTRTLLRFTVTTPNIGDADVFVGSPLKHMDPNGDGDFADQDGMFEFASCHGHFHFQHYATYKLIDTSGKVWKAAKRGFCMLDTDPYNVNNGDGTWSYRNCGSTTHDGFQGISDGWADTYVFKLGGQYFVLDGGDGQPVVPPGNYFIEVEVNPGYSAGNAACPLVTDPATGLCHQFAESNYANNLGRVALTIPAHPGRTGYGPLKNNNDKITAADDVDHNDKK
jgi:hypothetical protein